MRFSFIGDKSVKAGEVVVLPNVEKAIQNVKENEEAMEYISNKQTNKMVNL